MNEHSLAPVTGRELREWREARGYSLKALAEKLGIKSASTINVWEDGQDIPEVSQKVLRWLIRGEVPFEAEPGDLGSSVREDIGAVEMTVDAFEECLRRSREAGFASVTEWIAALVREELGSKAEGETLRQGDGEKRLARREVKYPRGAE